MLLTGRHVDKDDSRTLAMMLFGVDNAGADGGGRRKVDVDRLSIREYVAHQLRRKKDHGRAEALLIAAWAVGARPPPAFAAMMAERRDALKGEKSATRREAPAPRPARATMGAALPSVEVQILSEVDDASCPKQGGQRRRGRGGSTGR